MQTSLTPLEEAKCLWGKFVYFYGELFYTFNPVQKTLEQFDFLGMHRAVPSLPHSVVKKRSLGKLSRVIFNFVKGEDEDSTKCSNCFVWGCS